MTATTTDRLRNALRATTGLDNLDWATPPTPIHGGFWAEMYTVELADPPSSLAGRLVARIMPDPHTAALETAVQRHLHQCGLAVPAVRAASGPTSQLDRAWMLMDRAPGQPLLVGLTATSAVRRAPTLYRQLPDLLAEATAHLHRCPVVGPDLENHQGPADIAALLSRLAHQADEIRRHDLSTTARWLAGTTPAERVICHGDLHPYNLLVDRGQWTIIDWSTAAIADPHYDLGFTTLMLDNPPFSGPAPIRDLARVIGTRVARRFLHTYTRLTDTAIDPERLTWARRVHASRVLTELATWEHQGRTEAHRDHPWTSLRPVLEAELTNSDRLAWTRRLPPA